MRKEARIVFLFGVVAISILALGLSFPGYAQMNWTQQTPGFKSAAGNCSARVSSSRVYDNKLFVGTNYESPPTGTGFEVMNFDGLTWTPNTTTGFNELSDAWDAPSMGIHNDHLYVGTYYDSIWNPGGKVYLYNIWMGEFVQVNNTGFGDIKQKGIMCMASFDDSLFVGTEQASDGAGCEIWRTNETGGPIYSDWTQVNTSGFGDSKNMKASTMCVFNSYVYVGTRNPTDGCEIWRSDDGVTWSQVNTDGFGKSGQLDIPALCVFNGQLYAGTDRPEAYHGCQLWRSSDGVSWVQVVGDESTVDEGFGDKDDGSSWRIQGNVAIRALDVMGDYLYAGTYHPYPDTTGCEVWRSVDGVSWEMVLGDEIGAPGNGFGDPLNIAAFTLRTFQDGSRTYLYTGTESKAGQSHVAEMWSFGPLATPAPTAIPTATLIPAPSMTPTPELPPTATPTVPIPPTATPTVPIPPTATPTVPIPPIPSPTLTPIVIPSVTPKPTPTMTPVGIAAPPWILDYNGDGTSDIAIFREGSGLWAVRGVTRVYFGSSTDETVPGDYNGDGTTEIGIFRGTSGLWAIRGITRAYFGSGNDLPEPGDYDGDGTADIGIFRYNSGLWAIKGVTRIYFGGSSDSPASGYYNGDSTKDIGIFRSSSGLWAIRGISRIYFGSTGDEIVPGDYDGDGTWETGIFRGSSGLWAIRGITRSYFGSGSDLPIQADYQGDGRDDIGIFRNSSGLWAIRGISRVYFGGTGDIPVTR